MVGVSQIKMFQVIKKTEGKHIFFAVFEIDNGLDEEMEPKWKNSKLFIQNNNCIPQTKYKANNEI